jgi:hypothetical protein
LSPSPAAAAVGVGGYLKLSREPSLDHKLPCLASAGRTLILLSAIGAGLVLADQRHADNARTRELATAVQRLPDSLASDIEGPARRVPPARRSGQG